MYKVNMDVNNSLFLTISASFIDLLAKAGTLNRHIVRGRNGKLRRKILKAFSETNTTKFYTNWLKTSSDKIT